MSGDPMGCACAIGVIASHFNSPAWKDYVMTFTSTPTLVRLRYPRTQKEYDATKGYSGYNSYYDVCANSSYSVYRDLGHFDAAQANRELTWLEKLRICSKVDWGMTTNFLKAIDCVTTTAMAAGVQLPSRILTITDMQWDSANKDSDVSWSNESLVGKALEGMGGSGGSWKFHGGWDTGVEMIETMLSRTTLQDGTPLKMPQMIFWNARGGHGGYAVQAHQKNTAMVSGFSTSMLKVFLLDGVLQHRKDEPITTWDTLEKVLSAEDYTQIRMLAVSVGEGPFHCLQAVYDSEAIHMPKTYGKAEEMVAAGGCARHAPPPVERSSYTRGLGCGPESGACLSPPVSESDSMPSLDEGVTLQDWSTVSAVDSSTRLTAVESKVDKMSASLGNIEAMLGRLMPK